MNDKQRDPVDRLVAAYESMLERVHDAADSAEQKSVPWLRESLANARDRAVELGELSREEAEKVAHYVERDLHEAAGFIADTGQEFRDWLQFDWRLMQSRMLDMFAGMADQTSAALRGFAEQASQASLYHSGEVSAPGTLECVNCGHELQFGKTRRIPECPQCQGTVFRRKTAAADG